MKRGLNLAGAWLLVGTAGCGGDTHEVAVQQALTLVNKAANCVSNIKDELQKALKEAQGDKKEFGKSPAVFKALKKAEEQAEDLKKIAEEFVKVKQNVDLLRGSHSEEVKQANARKYAPKLVEAFERVQEERLALQDLFMKAEALDKDTVRPLRQKFREADGHFESLVRQR